MIESEKVVCIHDDVEQSGAFKLVDLGGDIGQQWRSTQDRPDALLMDPSTGPARDDDTMFGHGLCSCTKEVLEECLRTWYLLVEAVEEKMTTASGVDTEPEYGLADEDMLESAGITEEFSRQLLLRARKPRFTFVAPGLRLLTPEEIVDQPLKSIMTSQSDVEVHFSSEATTHAKHLPGFLIRTQE